MTSFYEELLDAIADKDLTRASELVRSGLDLDVPCDEGASALYPAILTGDVSLVRLMLEFGSNPNFIAHEPAASIYTEKPLELAKQARFLIDWDTYNPIVSILEEFGAKDP